MKAALIGYGYWGKILERYICTSDDFELAIIYDREFVDTSADDWDFDVAFVCTPVPTHYENCARLLTAGKHVFCEKPTTSTLEQLGELEQLAVAKNRVLYTDYIYTVSPSVNKLKEQLPSIGQLLGIDAKIAQFGNFYVGQSAAEVVGVHMLSALLHILEQAPSAVSAKSFANGQHGVADLEFGETLAHLEHSLLQPQKERSITAYGSQGILRFDMLQTPTLQQWQYTPGANNSLELLNQWSYDESNNLVLVLEQFAQYIQSANIQSNLNLAQQVLELL